MKNIAKIKDLPRNSYKAVFVDDNEILLIHTTNGNLYAIDAVCPHEGAPLSDGLLVEERIVCPWHHACFDCSSGKVVEPPALSDLRSYNIKSIDGEIFIDTDNVNSSKTVKYVDDVLNDKKYVIIGGGAAGLMAAKTLRENGYSGNVIIISKDDFLPYDRTELSKNYLKGNLQDDDVILNPEKFFKSNKIDIRTDTLVSSLDTLTKTITLDDGRNIVYDKLLIASGSKPVIPYIPGNELKNILALRSLSDAKNIKQIVKNSSKCVILGSSFIAMEAASALQEYDVEITVVSRSRLPFEKILGNEIGEFILKSFQSSGIKFILDCEATEFIGKDKVERIKLTNGKTIETDFVVLGIGVEPSTDFIRGRTLDDGSIAVDKYLKFTHDVFAAGDLATFPDSQNGRKIRVEHWRIAQQQGKTAALNMLGMKKEFNGVPFFQTSFLGMNIQYVGYADEWDEIYIDGKIKENDFIIYYMNNKLLKAVLGAGKDEELMIIEELFRLNKIDEIKKYPPDFEILKKSISQEPVQIYS